MDAVLVRTTLPPASSTLTAGEGVIEAPAAVVLGWTVKATLAAVPAETVIEVLVADVSPVAAAVNVYVPVRLRLQPANVATPDEAASGFVVQLSVPGPLATDRVTEAELVVTTLLFASSMETTGCCEKAVPPVAVELGSVVKITCVAVPGVMLNAELMPCVKPVLFAARV
jgi:hypothetical protein